MNMIGFYASIIFNILVFAILVAAVFSIFDANKRTKELENRLIDIQDELEQIKSAVCKQKPTIDTNA